MKTVRKNFSLTELLVVIAVIAILAGMLVPALMGVSDNAKISTTKQNMQNLASTLGQLYMKNKGKISKAIRAETSFTDSATHLPKEQWLFLQDTSDLSSNPDNGDFFDYLVKDFMGHEYFTEESLRDYWGKRFRIRINKERHFIQVWSRGPDTEWASGTDKTDDNPDIEGSDDIIVNVSF